MRCCRNISLTAGGASVASHGGRSEGRAAFPLAGSSRLTGIESNATTPPPHGNAAWREARSASAAFSAQNASESEYRQRPSSVTGKSRKKGVAEPREAQVHEGACMIRRKFFTLKGKGRRTLFILRLQKEVIRTCAISRAARTPQYLFPGSHSTRRWRI